MYSTEKIIDDFRKGIIVTSLPPPTKKKRKMYCEEHRTLNFNIHALKVITGIIKNIIVNLIDVTKEMIN